MTAAFPTVGLAGGYIQGGGHSALSTAFGLAADNALSFDVATPSGRLVTASPSQHQDLYWALSGGGGGNFGVVVSVTVRAHPDATVAGASFEVTLPEGHRHRLYQVVDAFHAALPALVGSGVTATYTFHQGVFRVLAMTGYNMTKADMQAALRLFREAVCTTGLALDLKITEFSSYHEHMTHYFSRSLPVGVALLGGRLISRSALAGFAPSPLARV